MERDLKRTFSRKLLLYSVGAMIAVGYMILPSILGLTDTQTDMVASILLAMGCCALVYEDHRSLVPKDTLAGSLTIIFIAILASAAIVLWSGVRFQALILIGMIIGGTAYWYLDRQKNSPTLGD
jgi:hypothetical protein